jgi:hypothetical protein
MPLPVRCPRCAAEFETLQRWSIDCPECGHAWQPPSNRTSADEIRDKAGQLVEGLTQAFIVGVGVLVIAAGIYLVLHVSEVAFSRFGLLTAILILFGLTVGGMARARFFDFAGQAQRTLIRIGLHRGSARHRPPD